MPNPFVGSPRALDRADHAELGSLLVVLQNGKPDRLILPGRRIWRSFRAPLIGDLQVVSINVGTVDVFQNVRNVATADSEGYLIANVPLKLRVRLDGSRGYEPLQAFLMSRGATFAEDLVDLLRNSVDAMVRSSLRDKFHEDLYRGGIGEAIFPNARGISFADGILVAESITIVNEVEWSPVFVELKAQKDRALVGLASQRTDSVLGVDKARIDYEITAAQYREFAVLARQLGVPVETFVRPEAIAASNAQAADLLGKLLEPGNRAILSRDPAMLGRLIEASGIGQFAQTSGLDNLTREVISSAEASAVHDSLRARPSEADRPWAIEPPSGLAHEPFELNKEQRLVRLLQSEPSLKAAIEGIGLEVAESEAFIVAVTLPTSTVTFPSDFPKRVAGLLQVQHVTVRLLRGSSYSDLVTNWLEQEIPASVLDSISTRVEVIDEGDWEVLSLSLGGEPRVAYSVEQSLNGVGNMSRRALERVLPFARFTISLD